MEKKNIIERYNLPKEIIYCKKCTISNQRPRISFDEKGVCSACNFSKFKKNIDWKSREIELQKLCDKYRKNTGEYDVIVPCSGGKDGSFVAHQLKTKYGMRPLCVTWAPMVYTDLGRRNLDNFIQSGFNHVLGTSNPEITKKLTYLSFRELGDPFQPFIYGQANFPLFMAIAYDVKLIMYGENGEVEYGGDMKNAYIPTRTIKDYNKHYFSGLSPEFWEKYNIFQKDLYPFKGPDEYKVIKNKIEMHFLGYYKFWDPQENFYYAKNNCNFSVNDERTEGTYSKYASLDDKLDGFHYYLAFIKFGIGRATSDSAHEVRDEKITRDEGIALVKKYDSEFPKKYYELFLEYCDINEEEFIEIIDSWRSDHVWVKKSNQWVLRKPIWETT
jgi:N-acetyl sugar amidotransferase